MNARPAPPGAAPPGNGWPVLALLVSLLVLPFVIAGGLYLSGWQPGRSSQHGVLLQPPQALPASGLLGPDGRPLATVELQGKWLLVLFGNGPCDDACSRRVDEMRRVQVSLNKEMGRLQRVILTDTPNDAGWRAWRARQPDLLVAAAPQPWLPGLAGGSTYRLGIVDPHGYLVLTYPPEVAAGDLRFDLERLLKFSWTG
ncbi:MAG: putative transrane protein [Proteobacteria bacterium]|nr:putative transrane protein [Pseudomonadota bacterium]